MKLRVSGRAEMAATAGPGGGAQVKNTSTNSTNSNTPNSRTTFKEVTSLIKVFDKEPAMAVIEEVKTTPPQGGNSGPPPQEAALTTPTLEEDTMEAEASNGDSSPPTSTAVVSWARTAVLVVGPPVCLWAACLQVVVGVLVVRPGRGVCTVVAAWPCDGPAAGLHRKWRTHQCLQTG